MFRRVCLYRRGLLIKIGMLLAAVPLVLYSNSGGPIPAVTGATRFFELSCNQSGCHNSFSLNPSGGSVMIGAPASYTPGSTVPITVTITDNTVRRIWGFQISARFLNGTQAGSFARGSDPWGPVVQLSPSGIQYANHQRAALVPGTSFMFRVMWTAPASSSGGDVVFNAAGNSGNADGQPTGDRIFTTEFISTPGTSAPPPRIGSGGIANGAAFQAGAMAPGTIISIFGENMATTTAQATTLPLPTDIGGTRVMVNSVPAPLFFVSPGQINAQVPFEVAGISPVNVVVQVSSQTSAPEPLQIAATSPGIFTVPSVGSGPGAIIDASTFQTIAPLPGGAPARPGQVVAIFCTGLGETNPPLASGAPGATSEPLNRTVQTPTVTFREQSTGTERNGTLQYSGAAPGFAALYQINVIVPNLAAGDHEVRITIGGQQSRAGVTIRVQP